MKNLQIDVAKVQRPYRLKPTPKPGTKLTKYLVFVQEGPRYITPKGHAQRQWLVRCKCGIEKLVHRIVVTSGRITSCGSCAKMRASKLSKAYILRNIKKDNNSCWNWQGSLSAGYGQTYIRKSNGEYRRLHAHRTSWLVFRGPFGKQWVLHKCENRRCCNPDHLYLGNASDNARDTWNGKHGLRLRALGRALATKMSRQANNNFGKGRTLLAKKSERVHATT